MDGNVNRKLDVASLLTFKPGVSEVLPAPALDLLDAVDDDGPPEDVGEAEDVDLLEGGARLRGQAQQPRPVVRELRVVQREGQLQRLLDLPLLPPGKEPAGLNKCLQLIIYVIIGN